MDSIRSAQVKLLRALHGKRGFLGLGISRNVAGEPELQVLWLMGVAIPPFPSAVDGFPICIRVSDHIVAQNSDVQIAGYWLDKWKSAWSKLVPAAAPFWDKDVWRRTMQESRPGLALQEARERRDTSDLYDKLTSMNP